MDLGLTGKKALVIGASADVGREIVKSLNGEGVDVILVTNNPDENALERLENAIARIRQEENNPTARLLPCPANKSSTDGVDTILKFVQAEFGTLDILVNNTGVPPHNLHFGNLSLSGVADWEVQCHNLLFSFVELIYGVVPYMREKRWGRIINILSISAKEPMPMTSLANSYRTAFLGLTKGLADELGPCQITVNGVLSGYVDRERMTDFLKSQASRKQKTFEQCRAVYERKSPLNRLAQPVEIANAVVFLASEAASYITGVNLAVDGGASRSIL